MLKFSSDSSTVLQSYCGSTVVNSPMFTPNRLIYRNLDTLVGFKGYLEDGVPNGVTYVLNHPAEVVREFGNGVMKITEGVRRAVKGVMHGVTEGVIEEGIEHVVMEDLTAGIKSLAHDVTLGAKEMTWDTAKNAANGEGGAAGKSFFGGLLKWALAVPKAVYKQAKGLLNTVIDGSRAVTAVVANVIGVKTELDGDDSKMVLRDHGLVKSLGPIATGLVGVTLAAPFGTRLRNRIARSTWRADVSASNW